MTHSLWWGPKAKSQILVQGLLLPQQRQTSMQMPHHIPKARAASAAKPSSNHVSSHSLKVQR